MRLADVLRGHDKIRRAFNEFLDEQVELGRNDLEAGMDDHNARARIVIARELRRRLTMADEKDMHDGSQASRR